MATSALKTIKTSSIAFASNASTTDMISSTHTEELVIALCGPIGSPLHDVGDAIRTMLLDSFGYTQCTYLRLSDFIVEHAPTVETPIPSQPGFSRISALIEAGNKLREKYGNGVLAELAIHKIRFDREHQKTVSQSSRYAPRRVVHIIDSIKNKEELELLRLVYRDMLYVVGVFAPLQTREANLKEFGLATAQIYTLVDRDSGEESEAGQTVSDTFPNCDFFLRTGDGTDSELKHRVERFLHLVLGTKVITPTFAETAMYSAAMASANSACLSRQVGAAVTDRAGDAISEHEIDKDKVRILAYDGVAPSQYLSLFRVPQNSRKKNGKLITMSLKDSSPRLEKSMEALPALEGLVVKSLLEKHLLSERGPQNDGSSPSPGTA